MVKTCEACCQPFLARHVMDGKLRNLFNRRFCLDCSPFGAHNRADLTRWPLELRTIDARKRRRRLTQQKDQTRRRRERKRLIVDSKGGRCQDCGYAGPLEAIELHHREPGAKEFAVGAFGGSLGRLLAEAEKCDLVCANCHREVHAGVRQVGGPSDIAESVTPYGLNR